MVLPSQQRVLGCGRLPRRSAVVPISGKESGAKEGHSHPDEVE